MLATSDEQLAAPWGITDELLAGLREEVSILNVAWGARKKVLRVPRPRWVERGVAPPRTAEEVRAAAAAKSADVSAAVDMLKATARGR
jgi:hypothetical protein